MCHSMQELPCVESFVIDDTMMVVGSMRELMRGGRVHRSGTARAVRFICEEGVTKVFSDTLRWYLPCFACWFVDLHVFNLPNKSTF